MPSRFPRSRFSALFRLLLPTFQVFSSWCGKSSSSSTSEYWLERQERKGLGEAPGRAPPLLPRPARGLTPAASLACLFSSGLAFRVTSLTKHQEVSRLSVKNYTDVPRERGRYQPIPFIQFRSGNGVARRAASFQMIQTKHIFKLWR